MTNAWIKSQHMKKVQYISFFYNRVSLQHDTDLENYVGLWILQLILHFKHKKGRASLFRYLVSNLLSDATWKSEGLAFLSPSFISTNSAKLQHAYSFDPMKISIFLSTFLSCREGKYCKLGCLSFHNLSKRNDRVELNFIT